MTVYYPNHKSAVTPLTMVTRMRRLPVAGEVVVRVGNRLEPDELVARTLVPSSGRRFPVARLLSIQERDLPTHVLLEDGADVEVGDILVRVGRLRQRVWRSPITGALSTAEAEQGYLIITPPSESLDLRAYLKGFVSAVEPYRSVTIQSAAALVQGAFGIGGEQHGVLRMAVTDAADELSPDMLDERSALSILIGGGPVGADALKRAIELRVRGLIVGSITENALRETLGFRGDADWDVGAFRWDIPPGASRRPFPLTLVVTEGFGCIPMCSRAFDLLASYDGMEVLIDGRTTLHGPGMQRPQVIIPLSRADPAEILEDEGAQRFAIGLEVRLLSTELLGEVGTITAFSRGLWPMTCGASYRVVQVRLSTGQMVEVPLENLEVLAPKRGQPER